MARPGSPGNLAALIFIFGVGFITSLLTNLMAGMVWWQSLGRAAAPSILYPICMAYFFGWPTNWWKAYFGQTVRVNITRIIKREQAGENSDEIQEEILQWVKGSTKGRWEKITPFAYKFRKRQDAVFFKLAWG